MLLDFSDGQGDWSVAVAENIGSWFLDIFANLLVEAEEIMSYLEFKNSFLHSVGTDLSNHIQGDFFLWLRERGLLIL